MFRSKLHTIFALLLTAALLAPAMPAWGAPAAGSVATAGFQTAGQLLDVLWETFLGWWRPARAQRAPAKATSGLAKAGPEFDSEGLTDLGADWTPSRGRLTEPSMKNGVEMDPNGVSVSAADPALRAGLADRPHSENGPGLRR